MKHTITITVDAGKIARKAMADDKREAMRAGVVRKAQTFRARKGAGSYRRRQKYPNRGE